MATTGKQQNAESDTIAKQETHKETKMIQVKRTRRQIDQVIITSLLAFCLNYAFIATPAKADCVELDIDIDAACTDMGSSSLDPTYTSCAPAYDQSYTNTPGYYSGSGSGTDCATNYSSSTSGTNYGTNYGSNYGTGSSYGSGCQNTTYSSSCGSSTNCSGGYTNPYNTNSNQNRNNWGPYSNGSYTNYNNIGNHPNYSTYDKIYNAGYQQNTSPNGLVSTTRTPLIYGAPNTPAQQMVQPGQGPAIGDGQTPAGVTPGMGYYQNDYPASHVSGLPDVPAGIEGKFMINGMVQPYLRPPTGNYGQDPGIIDNPPDYCQPPVTTTQINPGGGIQGDAPINRWGGQTTRDFGYGSGVKRQCNAQNDFGQPLLEKPDLFAVPQCSQDGPRPEYGMKSNSPSHRNPNRENAHATTDRQGNRTLFKGPERRSQATLANY